MDASFNKGATMIALKAIPALSGRSFAPGDVVPWRNLAVSERRVAQMVGANMIGELSQETWDFALRRRLEADGPARGITPAGLEALGIVDAPEEAAPKPAPAKAKKPEAEVAYTETLVHRGYALRGKKQGIVVAYDVFNAAQERLNPGGLLRGMNKVNQFIDTLEAEAARVAAAKAPQPGTPAGEGPAVEGSAAEELQTPADLADENYGEDSKSGAAET